MPPRAYAQEFGFYARNGARKYLNQPSASACSTRPPRSNRMKRSLP
jgi:hypothetical protein